MRGGLLPSHLIVEDGLIGEDFAERLDAFKKATGLSWGILAACAGVDPRQLERWRKGTKPSGDGLNALILLAARVPGGFLILFGVHVIPPARDGQLRLGVDVAPFEDGEED
ncbi:MAG: hypothetical protein OXK21_07710 [Chloroflexota bacterium]|nr:hypothetical protein [Chloroflexota bacterium]